MSFTPSFLRPTNVFTRLSFNPIAPTLLKKALTGLIDQHFSRAKSQSHLIAPTKEMIDTIVESANGDIRSAIMALQFSCIPGKTSKGKKRGSGSTVLMEAITRRESSLALFHLIGRVLYNKRMFVFFSTWVIRLRADMSSGKGDPSSASASAKDLKKEKEVDAKLKDPPALPIHLREHGRRASRVDVDVRLYYSFMMEAHIQPSAIYSRCMQTLLSILRCSRSISIKIILSSATSLMNVKV